MEPRGFGLSQTMSGKRLDVNLLPVCVYRIFFLHRLYRDVTRGFKMTKRLFEDNEAWGDVTSRCNNEVEALFAAVLAKVEAELGEPVDLRDFHFVGSNALASFVAELSIQR